ncbi:MAG: helix-turn-helix domain-containing protein [bacterium]|nr:helix-turn-helix domain-containing protein [bacterium]
MREKVINYNEIYTTSEARKLLKISESTIKRLLKRGIIRANKVGGQYRILGKELLRLVSPEVERGVIRSYQKLKRKIKKSVKNW